MQDRFPRMLIKHHRAGGMFHLGDLWQNYGLRWTRTTIDSAAMAGLSIYKNKYIYIYYIYIYMILLTSDPPHRQTAPFREQNNLCTSLPHARVNRIQPTHPETAFFAVNHRAKSETNHWAVGQQLRWDLSFNALGGCWWMLPYSKYTSVLK